MQLKQRPEHLPLSSSVFNAEDDPGNSNPVRAETVWGLEEWSSLHASVATRILQQDSETSARAVTARWGRRVLRSYSSSFYAVTRFLPEAKRADVEMVYAAVRFPDEVVDTFDIGSGTKHTSLESWQAEFRESAEYPDIATAVKNRISPTIAGFRDVSVRNNIPDEHYLSFLEAMRSDISPQLFADWHELIDRYIYGSATVVGYFLAHIYRPAPGGSMDDCLTSAKALAVALQLTNFARDVSDDSARGRCYLPVDSRDRNGDSISDGVLFGDRGAMMSAVRQLAEQAATWYEQARPGISSFNPDSRIAIEACHRLYSRLNDKILQSHAPEERASLTVFEKLSVLPRSKYWRLPKALVFER